MNYKSFFRWIVPFVLFVFFASPCIQAQKVRVQIEPFKVLKNKLKEITENKDADNSKENNEAQEEEVNNNGVYDFSKLHIEEPPKSYTDLFTSNERFSEKSKYLRKAIRENNTERVIGFLERGGLPYDLDVIGKDRGSRGMYPAINNKNYDILEAVYNKYPEAIRFSQLLHYACSLDFDPKMIDWLVAHGASLDMNGYVTVISPGYGTVAKYYWNDDETLALRPIDVALRYGKLETVDYLMKKYNSKVLPLALSTFFVDYIHSNTDEQIIALVKEYEKKGIGDPKEYINVLSLANPKLGIKKDYPLIKAIKDGKNEFAKYAIDNCDADINVFVYEESAARSIGVNVGSNFYESPFSVAISQPHNQDMINFLISHGVKTRKDVVTRFAHKEYREEFILQGLID